ncbi:MAG: dienelactone hydrolase family protein [Clostridia bacterium]|nr:dienelactone hydrolase family protein [Clostridia bacterium]
MINFIHGHDNLIIVLHEIYGINRHMLAVCTHYSSNGFDVMCPNLLGEDQVFDYADEAQAYSNFKATIGFSSAKSQVMDCLSLYSTKYKKVFILGFSIGATTAWLLSSKSVRCDGIIAYYGSRIRDYVDIDPEIPTLLIFPDEETSFDVKALIPALEVKRNVEVHVLQGRHGFSDPFAKHYCKESHNQSLSIVDSFLHSCLNK